MKRLINPVLCLFVVLSITSCSKNKNGVDIIEEQGNRPFVDYDIVKGDDPFTFQFKNKSSNYKSLEWRFGDDSLSTEDSPTHLYLTTDTFEVILTGISESGDKAKKLLKINLVPDSIVQITAPPTNVPNQVKFNVESTADVASAKWTFEDNSTSTELSPVRTYAEGTLNKFTFQMTTPKGSALELVKFATTSGIVTDITKTATLSVSSDNSGGKTANEGSLKIIDGNVDTKLYQGWPGSFWAQLALPAQQTVKFYGIGSANDTPNRDPKDWTLQGSNDGINWEIIDTRTGIAYNGVYKKMFYYAVANPKPFSFYRWNVTANNGDGGFQISELKLFK